MNYPTRKQAEALAKCSQTDLCPQTCKAREWCDMDDTVTEKGYLNMHDVIDAKDAEIVQLKDEILYKSKIIRHLKNIPLNPGDGPY